MVACSAVARRAVACSGVRNARQSKILALPLAAARPLPGSLSLVSRSRPLRAGLLPGKRSADRARLSVVSEQGRRRLGKCWASDVDVATDVGFDDDDDDDGRIDADGLYDLDRDQGLNKASATALGAVRQEAEGWNNGKPWPARRRLLVLSNGSICSLCLALVLLTTLLVVDAFLWRLIRRPLAALFLTLPFLFSALLSAALGFLAVPALKQLKANQILREEGPSTHSSKAGTPTMGGLYFIPVGVLVAWAATGAPPELHGAVGATLGYMLLGALDDYMSLAKKHNYGLSGRVKLLLQAAGGAGFFLWFSRAPISHPYTWKLMIPLPAPFGLWYMGPLYLPLTAFTFAAMSNSVNLTDGLDGLAAGTSAVALIAMAVAVLPLFPSLSMFASAMAGSCVGFLVHNSNPAKVFMGDTGALALGAALAVMGSASGLFLPLMITSVVFALEALSVILQVSVFQWTKRANNVGFRLFRMAPFHHHLELSGWAEVTIVAMAYAAVFVASLLAVYVALISV